MLSPFDKVQRDGYADHSMVVDQVIHLRNLTPTDATKAFASSDSSSEIVVCCYACRRIKSSFNRLVSLSLK